MTVKVIDLQKEYEIARALSGGPAKVGPASNWFPPVGPGGVTLPLPFPPKPPVTP